MDDSKALSCFFLGLGVGVAVGMVFAPQSGSDTRGLIGKKAHEGGDFLKHKAQESGDYLRKQSETIRDSATDLVDRSKTAVHRQKESLASAVDAGKQAYRDTVSSPAAEPSSRLGESI